MFAVREVDKRNPNEGGGDDGPNPPVFSSFFSTGSRYLSMFFWG